MIACTIIARNYLAQARVLAESFFEYHPEGEFTVLLLDDKVGLESERFRTAVPTDVGLPEDEYLRMAAIYDVMELATAVKPWLLRHLLTKGEPVLYLDPDIELFAPLDELTELAGSHRLALTPHVTVPLPYDPAGVVQNAVRLGGVFNLGFLGLDQRNERFLDWWDQRLRRDCVVAPERGIFVDQRWFDVVPSLFEHVVIDDPSVNVAWWNLATRDLRRVEDDYTVDGRPLSFFHFSGFDPRQRHLLSKHQGPEPPILLSNSADLQALCERYAERLEEHGFSRHVEEPYRFERVGDGVVYEPRMRRLYREALLEAEHEGEPRPPNPFDDPERFMHWLAEPTDRTGQAARISRYLHALRADRQDLQQRFHDLRWLDGDAYAKWAATEGMVEERIPPEVVVPPAEQAAPEEPGTEEAREPGVNVVGYLQAEAGVGEAGRLVAAAVRKAGLPMATLTYRATVSRQEHVHADDDAAARFETNLICVNADQLPAFTYEVGPEFFAERYSIGVWWWEVAQFPAWLHRAFDIVHEVWVGSEHVARAISSETTKPVLVFPLPVQVPEAPPLDRGELGIPEGYLFLFSFDFLSVFDRKNPLGLIDAFKQAFEPGEGPILVLKSINGDKKVVELERLRAAAAHRPDIVVIDGYVSAEQKNALMASCDCYVSLHRSEGFGLTLAEAMAYGRPVIATGYSGNLDFMDETNSYLVPSREVPIPRGADPYPAGAMWGDPDSDEAARLMRFVYTHPDEATAKGRAAQAAIRENRSLERSADFVRMRLEEIRSNTNGAPRAPDEAPATVGEIDHAQRFLSNGPSVPIRAPSRFGRLGIFTRRAVYRLLRPYLVRQRELEDALVASLRGLDKRIAEVETRSHEREMTSTHLLASASEQLDRASRTAAETTIRLEHAADDVRAEVADAHSRAAAAQGQAELLDRKLHDRVFVSSPEELAVTDAQGRPAIGYRGGSGGDVYVGFENVFRGSETLIRDRQRFYVDVVREHAPVLDVGSGRGEFLDELADANIAARGIDIDPAMVQRARGKGHDVELADAIAYLEGLADDSLGTVFAAQVVEHLSYDDLVAFLRLAHAKLRSDGLLVFETVNPYSVGALRAFWVDLTHKLPIYPEVALVLCRLVGFDEAVVVFPNGTGELERDRRDEGEYAVVARRGGDDG